MRRKSSILQEMANVQSFIETTQKEIYSDKVKIQLTNDIDGIDLIIEDKELRKDIYRLVKIKMSEKLEDLQTEYHK